MRKKTQATAATHKATPNRCARHLGASRGDIPLGPGSHMQGKYRTSIYCGCPAQRTRWQGRALEIHQAKTYVDDLRALWHLVHGQSDGHPAAKCVTMCLGGKHCVLVVVAASGWWDSSLNDIVVHPGRTLPAHRMSTNHMSKCLMLAPGHYAGGMRLKCPNITGAHGARGRKQKWY